jgi:hypothetical protein
MTPAFQPLGPSGIIAYADDSTDTSTAIENGGFGLPNALLVFNPDTANVVVVNYSFDALDTNAVVPTSGFNGIGTVVGPLQQVVIRMPSTYVQGNVFVSVAGDSATGNVWITPGTL